MNKQSTVEGGSPSLIHRQTTVRAQDLIGAMGERAAFINYPEG
jgi:hypothetical protein